MKTTVKMIALAAMASLLSACVSTNNPDMMRNAGVGAVMGALAGQAIGHDTEATVAGAAVGAIIGSQVNTSGYRQPHYQNRPMPQHQGKYQTRPMPSQHQHYQNNGYYYNNGY